MSLVVNGLPAAKRTIQKWLNQICGDALADSQSGVVTFGVSSTNYKTGCQCIEEIIQSNRTVTIQPLPYPTAQVPNSSAQIASFGGGVTHNLTSTYMDSTGSPGIGPDNHVGSDAIVYIDMSNNQKKGYRHRKPMWLVLAHELTSGHAYHSMMGTELQLRIPSERQAIGCENVHALDHGMRSRSLP